MVENIMTWSVTVLFTGLGVLSVVIPFGVVLLTLWDAVWSRLATYHERSSHR